MFASKESVIYITSLPLILKSLRYIFSSFYHLHLVILYIPAVIFRNTSSYLNFYINYDVKTSISLFLLFFFMLFLTHLRILPSFTIIIHHISHITETYRLLTHRNGHVILSQEPPCHVYILVMLFKAKLGRRQ